MSIKSRWDEERNTRARIALTAATPYRGVSSTIYIQQELIATCPGATATLARLFELKEAPSQYTKQSGVFAGNFWAPLPEVRDSIILLLERAKPACDITVSKRSSVRRSLLQVGIHYAEARFLRDEHADYFLISTDIHVLRELIRTVSEGLLAENYDDEYHRSMGRLFGHPECCIERYIGECRIGQKWSGYDEHDSQDNYPTCHFWCKRDCSESTKLQGRHRRVIATWKRFPKIIRANE